MKNKQSKYLQLLFVFAAFALMAGAAYLFNSRMLRNHLLNGAQELLLSAEANVKAALSETEVTLLNSYYIVQGMLERDASKQEILDYFIITTGWMQHRDAGLIDFYGIYGFIYGEFYDGIGMNPGEDYIPQTRPWYQTAIRSGTHVAYTAPYIDWHTGDTIVSAVRNIFINNSPVGILVVDININWLTEYVGSLALTEDGFGMLLSQNLSFMAYPDKNFLGMQLQELGGVYDDLARTLRSGGNVFARQIIDPDRGTVIVFINQIFNHWYVGLITPASRFYHDLRYSALIMIILGFILSLALCFVLISLSAAKERSDEESRAKSSFLARMSHEIRTPLNAVIGLSEIVLNRGKLPSESANDLQQIHQSGASLLGIINDILDISKIEAGGFELVPVEYCTASLINDTVNLNKVRIGSKPIIFLLEINGDFPARLLGDELRVRQVLNNILSNAIKYTKTGTIKLTVNSELLTEKLYEFKTLKQQATMANRDYYQYFVPCSLISFTVADTGAGIRPEDLGKLFSEYTQLNIKQNRKVEGTGLGLAITKKLVEMMGGTITAESEFGKGSVFTVSLMQGLPDTESIGEETAEKLKFFEYTNPAKEKEFDHSWMPYGKVLVVDDLPVNLQVARGLLEPYGLSIDTAESGQEAIYLIQGGNKYDIVFMDHMMPGMDGIEAVRIIRSWENPQSPIPIIALTANALAGNMEMFLSKGFNGFIPKPIDIGQLDDTLKIWIRDKQNQETVQQAKKERTMNNSHPPTPNPQSLVSAISGLDTQRGIAMTGGTEAGYIAVLTMFCKDAEDRMSFFQTVPQTDALVQFATQVHALKSASGSIGAAAVSALAAELESAAKTENIAVIQDKLPVFTEQLAELVKNITSALEKQESLNSQLPTPNSQFSTLNSQLLKDLAAALESHKANDISRIVKEIKEASRERPLDAASKEAFEQISDEVMMVEYDNARKIVEELLATYNAIQ
ncbi:MAG: ATP-binding protein [Treponema sp.]|nr:ATP-binding protein [Treponema sp.]